MSIPQPEAPSPVIEDKLDLERGYRYVTVKQPDGSETREIQLLASHDFLNPREGDIMPQRPFHKQADWDLGQMLIPFLKTKRPELTAFGDLIMRWGIPGLDEPSPDLSIIPNVRDPETDRDEFDVLAEGTRPILIVEIVSPRYRREDREKKVEIYERAGVLEYVILDRVRRKGQRVDEIRGYRLAQGTYREILPDEDGRLYCETIGVFIALEDGRVALWDAETGERLRTADEAQRVAAEAETRAEKAEARLAELEAELARLRGKPA